MDFVEYRIVSAKATHMGNAIRNLETKVNEAIEQGWVPNGNPNYIPRAEHLFLQTMVRFDEEN